MDLLKGALGGIIGGVIGAGIWALVAYNAHVESGWIAWGVGALVGFGVSIGMRGSGGAAAGILAIVIALASIVGSKYAAVQLMADAAFKGKEFDKINNFVFTDEMMLESLVEDAAREVEKSGKTVAYKNGKTLETAESIADYPDWIVRDRKTYYDGLTDADRAYLRKQEEDKVHTGVNEIKSQVTADAFTNSFSAFDAIFGLFAIITAWRVGASERD